MLMIVVVLTGALHAQRKLDISGNHLSVSPQDQPQNGAVYSYLWWFGDGSYKITEEDNTLHSFYPYGSPYNTNLRNAVPGLITTENYGTEGNPDLIFADSPIPINSGSTSDFPKILDPSDSSDFVRVNYFRNAVPGDTFFLIVTYGVPDLEMYTILSWTILDISLEEEETGLSPFEFIIDNDWNLSFLPHGETARLDSSNSSRIFIDNHHNGYNYFLGGHERTILLPVKYNGTLTKGTVKCIINFEFFVDSPNGTGGVENELNSASIKLAASHDPNQVQVSIDTTTCICGGQELYYEVQFENTGDGQTDYVRIEMQLDSAHDLNSLEMESLPRWFEDISEGEILGYQPNYSGTGKDAYYHIDEANNRVIFEFHNIFLIGLLDTLTSDPSRAKDYISFKIKVKDGYVIGDPITAFASIFFDNNEPVVTNVVETTCPNPNSTAGINEDCNTFFVRICWDCWLWYGGILLVLILIIVFWVRWRRNQRRELKNK